MTAKPKPVEPFVLAQELFHLAGQPLDLKSYPYLRDIYNTGARRVCLFTGRQVSKCHAKGTLITLASGELVSIQDVPLGAEVVSVTDTFQVQAKKVLGVYSNGVAQCLRIRTQARAIMVVTPNHKLRGRHGYTHAVNLRIGDVLACMYSGELTWDPIESIEPAGKHEVYDLEVEGEHNYLVDTGIVSHNSTTLATKLVMRAAARPRTSLIYIAPLQDQAEVFSLQRVRDFTTGSPIIANNLFKGRKVIDQVFRKVFSNASVLAMSYAQRSADRIRGRSISDGGTICWDEIQDIHNEVLAVVEELAFRAVGSTFDYCGTPKTLQNHMELMRSKSTENEWGVRCQETGCKKWNLEWDERNIGDKGVICRHCGALLNTDGGEWIASRRMDIEKGKDARIDREGFRIPQLIVRPIMSNPTKWIELLGKQRDYPSAQFRNEVLGLPSEAGEQPVTYEQLAACCDNARENEVPDGSRGIYPALFAGVDWAVNAAVNLGNSHTVLIIGGWNPYPTHLDIYYYRVFKGQDAGTRHEIEHILDCVKRAGVRLVGADWGSGSVQNMLLMEALGVERVAQMFHAGNQGGGTGSKAPRAVWNEATMKWHLSRTRVITDIFELVRKKRITFPRETDCRVLFDHFQAMSLEYNVRTNTQHYVNIKPDDCIHASVYMSLAGELYLQGNFQGHAGSAPTNGYYAEAEVEAEAAGGDDWI